MNDVDRDQLFSRLIEGELSPDEFAALDEQLKTSQEWREAYLDFIDIHNLVGLTSAPVSTGTGVISMKTVLQHQRVRALKISAVAAAAVLMIGGVALRMMQVDQQELLSVDFKVAPATRFEITKPGGDKKDGGGFELVAGAKLRVDQGAVELSFPNGVRSLVMGPAHLKVLAENELSLDEGRGWFTVPDGAEGFTVIAPDCRVVDLGTTFGVDVLDDRPTEVHVIEGLVRGETESVYNSQVEIEEEQAVKVMGDEGLVAIEYDPERFVSTLPDSLPYVHWSFDEMEDGGFLASGSHPDGLVGRATSENSATPVERIDGVFGKAVRFDGTKGQQLRTALNGIGGDRARSIACWVRADYAPYWERGGDIGGLLGWGLCLDDMNPSTSNSLWSIHVGFHGQLVASGGAFYTAPPNVADGKWHHVACVARPINNPNFPGGMVVVMYVDGERQGEWTPAMEKASPMHTQTVIFDPESTPVTIGSSIHKPGTPPIVFQGDIDEMYLFYGALDDKSVLRLMERNEPRE